MPYNPSRPPEIKDIEELRKFVEAEFRVIAEALNEVEAVELRPIFVAPAKPRDGMMVFADGTSFNPGGGAGVYERRGGAWVKL